MAKKEKEHSYSDSNGDRIVIEEIDTCTSLEFSDLVWEKFEETQGAPILINIDSYGGDVDAMFSIMDTMDSIRVRAPKGFAFITFVTGKAMSSACDILAHGDVRVAHPRSRIMSHHSSGGSWGKNDDALAGAEDNDRMNTVALELFAKNIKFRGRLDTLRRKLDTDTYFTAEQAKAFGIIDIVGSAKTKMVIKHTIDIVKMVDNGRRK